jgi:hypothetical protein
MRTLGTLSLLSLAAAMGCANVIGASDYQVGSGGTQTSAGVGGQAGGTPWWSVGGSTNSGGQAGAGGGATGGGGNATGGGVNAGASGGGGIPDGGNAGAAKDASQPETGTLPGSNSGDTTCSGPSDCPGALHCEFMLSTSTTGLCVEYCTSTCDASHWCLSGATTNYACLRNCTTEPCAADMTCMDFGTTTSLWACIPNIWFPTKVGIGDKCYANSDCISGDCTSDGTLSGWCTEPCSLTNDLCAGTAVDGYSNSYGEPNWCIQDIAGAYKCAPGCLTASTCDYYAGTTCQYLVGVDTKSHYICAP